MLTIVQRPFYSCIPASMLKHLTQGMMRIIPWGLKETIIMKEDMVCQSGQVGLLNIVLKPVL